PKRLAYDLPYSFQCMTCIEGENHLDIRLSTEKEWGHLAELWLRISLEAHNFVDSSYWISKKADMEETYLPHSQTYVCLDQGQIVGFISMVDDYLAALFVAENFQGKGYGRRMLEFVKQGRDMITLKVFVKNASA